MGDAVIDNKSDEINIKEWIVLKGPAGSYIGKPKSFNLNAAGGDDGWKNEIINAISQGDCVELEPVFEFIAPLRPMQGPEGKMVFTRDPVVVGVDFIMHGASVFVKAAGVYFCADLQGDDVNTYKSFVTQATRAALESRARKMGIEVAQGLPPGLKGRSRA